MNHTTKTNIHTAAKWSSLTELLAKLITPVINMILARLLLPDAFGAAAAITMVISFAELFTDAGFQKYLIQHEFPDSRSLEDSTDAAFWSNLTVSAVLTFVIFLFRHPIARLIGNPGLGNAVGVSSLLILIAAFSGIPTARFRRSMDFRTLFYVRLGTALLPLPVTVPAAFVLRDYRALLIGTFGSQLFSAVFLTVRSGWKPSFRFSFAQLKEMLSFSVWTMLESVSVWMTSYAGVFLVANELNTHYLGLYKTSMATVNGFMAIITGAVTPVLFSALSRYQKEEAAFRDTFFFFQRITALFVLPMGIGLFVYRDLATRILLGKAWAEAGDFIGWWGLTGAFTIVFSHFSSEVYRSKGDPKRSLLLQLLHLAFLVPALLLSVPHGFDALCLARSLIRIQSILTSLLVLHFRYGFRLPDVLRSVFPMFLSACLMGIAGYGMKSLSPSIVWQVLSVFFCILLYFSLLLLFPELRRKFKTIILKQRKLFSANRNKPL